MCVCVCHLRHTLHCCHACSPWNACDLLCFLHSWRPLWSAVGGMPSVNAISFLSRHMYHLGISVKSPLHFLGIFSSFSRHCLYAVPTKRVICLLLPVYLPPLFSMCDIPCGACKTCNLHIPFAPFHPATSIILLHPCNLWHDSM